MVKDKKETEDFNNTIKQLDLTDIHRILHPTKAEYTFFSSVLDFQGRTYVRPKKVSIN